MPNKTELLQEAYKRGILPPDKLPLYEEAVKRGLIGSVAEVPAPPEQGPTGTPATEMDLPLLHQRFQGQPEAFKDLVPPIEKQQQLFGLAEDVVVPVAGTGGAIAGAPLGLVGAAGGGGLATGIAKQGMQHLGESLGVREPQTLPERSYSALVDTAIGAAEEFAGQKILGPAVATLGDLVGGAKKLAKEGTEAVLSTKGAAQKRASRLYDQLTEGAPISTNTIERAQQLEKEIPGFKLTRGQQTGDYSTRKFEAGTGDPYQQNMLKENNLIALDNYLEHAKGSGQYSKAIQRLEEYGINVNKQLTDSLESLAKNKAKYNPVIDKETSGNLIATKAENLEREAIEFYGTPFTKETKPIVDITGVTSTARRLMGEWSSAALGKSKPAMLAKYLKKFGQEGDKAIKKMSPKELQAMRQELGEEIRRDKKAGLRNKVRQMTEFDTALDDALESSVPLMSKELRQARAEYKLNVIDKFRGGTVGDMLQRTKDSAGFAPAEVMQKFFQANNKGAKPVKDFKRAFGDDPEVMKEMTDYIDHRMVKESTEQSSNLITDKKLQVFRNKYEDALKEFGLYDRYSSVSKASQRVENASKLLVDYKKTAASRMINKDLDSAIRKAFKDGEYGKGAKELMRVVSNNPDAKEGLQNGIMDYIVEQAGGKVTKLDPLMKKFANTYSTVFSGPAGRRKVSAMKDYQKALGLVSKDDVGKFFKGDLDTARKFLTNFIKVDRVTQLEGLAWVAGMKAIAQNWSDAAVVKLLKEAAVDPEKALTLKLMAKKQPKKGQSLDPAVRGRLEKHFAGMTLRSAEPTERLNERFNR